MIEIKTQLPAQVLRETGNLHLSEKVDSYILVIFLPRNALQSFRHQTYKSFICLSKGYPEIDEKGGKIAYKLRIQVRYGGTGSLWEIFVL